MTAANFIVEPALRKILNNGEGRECRKNELSLL